MKVTSQMLTTSEGRTGMRIEHLYDLKEIAESKSITAASKKLYIAQTTLSAVVKSIEYVCPVREDESDPH